MPRGIYVRTEHNTVRYWLGKKRSADDKKKMSLSAKRRCLLGINIPPSRKGAKQSKEAIEKTASKLRGIKRPLDIILRGAEKRKGINHWNWKGGVYDSEEKKIRKSLKYKLWRKSVFERDNYTCMWCKERGGTLHPDHIKRFADYPELRFDLNNGRTLCIDCHKKTDTYGNKKQKSGEINKTTAKSITSLVSSSGF